VRLSSLERATEVAELTEKRKQDYIVKFTGVIIAAGLALAGVSSASAGVAAAATHDTSSTSTAGSRHGVAASTIGYDIRIHTANVNYAGTDGDVWLRVNGTNGSTQYWYLDDSADNYERNRTDHFLRSGGDAGTIRSVTIYFNPLGGGDAEWLPDRITVNGVTVPRSPNTIWFQKGDPSYRTFLA
jgi:hypothetical protein